MLRAASGVEGVFHGHGHLLEREDRVAPQAASSIARQARSGGCTAYLGTDTAVQEDWSALLSRLRSSSRLITALNELAVIAKDA